jgi:hypothetical protein
MIKMGNVGVLAGAEGEILERSATSSTDVPIRFLCVDLNLD